MNLILDLDNTLISSADKKEMSKLKGINHTLLNSIKMDGTDFTVFSRPHLQEFLDFAFANFNVTVWTAASQSYGEFIIRNILFKNRANSRFNMFFFHDENCKQSEKMFKSNSPKDLRYLYYIKHKGKMLYQPCNTVIVDDLPAVAEANPKNVIRAKYFDVKDNDAIHDTFLLQAINILKNLKHKFESNPCTVHSDHSHKIHNPHVFTETDVPRSRSDSITRFFRKL